MKTFNQIAGSVPFSSFQSGGKRRSVRRVKRKTVRRKTRRSLRRTPRRTTRRTLRRSVRRISRKQRKPVRRNRRRSTRRDTRRSNRRARVKRGAVIKRVCQCDKKKIYKGNEPSPKGFGYCAHCMPLNVTMKGTDGNLWENQPYKKGNRWVMVRNDMMGGSP